MLGQPSAHSRDDSIVAGAREWWPGRLVSGVHTPIQAPSGLSGHSLTSDWGFTQGKPLWRERRAAGTVEA